MSTADSLFRALDLIEPSDLVTYHGSLPEYHGLYLAVPCDCATCRLLDERGSSNPRYRLIDPWQADSVVAMPRCVRRTSIRRAVGGS